MKLNLIGILFLSVIVVLAAVVFNKANSPAEASPVISEVAQKTHAPALDNRYSFIVAVNGKVETLSLTDIRALQQRGTDVYLVDEAYLS